MVSLRGYQILETALKLADGLVEIKVINGERNCTANILPAVIVV